MKFEKKYLTKEQKECLEDVKVLLCSRDVEAKLLSLSLFKSLFPLCYFCGQNGLVHIKELHMTENSPWYIPMMQGEFKFNTILKYLNNLGYYYVRNGGRIRENSRLIKK